jgi:hypothetical protein
LPLSGLDGRSPPDLLAVPRAPGGESPGETAPKEGEGRPAGGEEAAATAPRDRLVTRSDTPASASRLVLLALAVSGIAHLAFLMPAVILGDAHPLDTSPVQAISVEIVPPEEEAKPAEPQPEIKPEIKSEPPSQIGSALPASPPPAPPAKPIETAAPTPPALPQAWPQPGPVPAATDATDVFGLPLTLPGGMIGYEYQRPATEQADLAEEAKAAFRRHLKACLTLPASVTARMSAGAKVTVQINLNPDGTLMNGPENPHAVGQIHGLTTGGGDIYNAVKAAALKCQPYTMLPADRYGEWHEIHLTFTPENIRGE